MSVQFIPVLRNWKQEVCGLLFPTPPVVSAFA